MSRVRDWLRARAPGPVMELERWLAPEGAAAAADADGREREGRPGRSAAPDGDVPVSEELARAAGLALERALARPGRIRESAFDLLAADALFTWACEAALEEDEPEERLHRILEETLGR